MSPSHVRAVDRKAGGARTRYALGAEPNDEASNFFMVLFWLISFASSLIFTYLYCGVLQKAHPTAHAKSLDRLSAIRGLGKKPTEAGS